MSVMQKGRILALDYGTKHVGIACCDELGVGARPLPPIPFKSHRDLMLRLRSLLQQNEVHEIVVGIPLNMDGTSGEAVHRVQRFMDRLREEFGLPLIGVDERLSTVEAMELWNHMSTRQQRKYRTVDSLAAALILNRYLEGS